ncbi:MAG: hypothetical protein AAF364_06250 [Pseudomonadota bacterium]
MKTLIKVSLFLMACLTNLDLVKDDDSGDYTVTFFASALASDTEVIEVIGTRPTPLPSFNPCSMGCGGGGGGSVGGGGVGVGGPSGNIGTCGNGKTINEINAAYIAAIDAIDAVKTDAQHAIKLDAVAMSTVMAAYGVPSPLITWATTLYGSATTMLLSHVARKTRERIDQEYNEAMATC